MSNGVHERIDPFARNGADGVGNEPLALKVRAVPLEVRPGLRYVDLVAGNQASFSAEAGVEQLQLVI